MKIKVCGLASPENIREISSLRPDMMGFIFYAPSPRNACALLHSNVTSLPDGIERVGVFVDSPLEHTLHVASRYALTTIQLHGKESPEMCRAVRENGYKVMKAIGVNATIDWETLSEYKGNVDYLVLDTLTAVHGGSGRKFDWTLLSDYHLDIPFLLSGGIGPDDAASVVKAARELPSMIGVDINSRFESSPGIKNIRLLNEFITEIRSSI